MEKLISRTQVDHHSLQYMTEDLVNIRFSDIESDRIFEIIEFNPEKDLEAFLNSLSFFYYLIALDNHFDVYSWQLYVSLWVIIEKLEFYLERCTKQELIRVWFVFMKYRKILDVKV